jgi:hypothetical protein
MLWLKKETKKSDTINKHHTVTKQNNNTTTTQAPTHLQAYLKNNRSCAKQYPIRSLQDSSTNHTEQTTQFKNKGKTMTIKTFEGLNRGDGKIK